MAKKTNTAAEARVAELKDALDALPKRVGSVARRVVALEVEELEPLIGFAQRHLAARLKAAADASQAQADALKKRAAALTTAAGATTP